MKANPRPPRQTPPQHVPNPAHTMLLMSWMSTVRVDSPDQPRLLLAVTINRAPGSTTARTAKKFRWQRTMRRCVRGSPRSRCGDGGQKTHPRAQRERKKKDSKVNARGSRRGQNKEKLPTDLRDNAPMVPRDNLEWHARPASAPSPSSASRPDAVRFARFTRVPEPDIVIRRPESIRSRACRGGGT